MKHTKYSYERDVLNLPEELLNFKTGYVYKLHFKPTNQYYIGSRYSNSFFIENDFWCNYFTSSKVVKKLLTIYDAYDDNYWSYEILQQFSTHEEAINAENILLQSIISEDKCHYLNINFSAGGAVLNTTNKHIKLYDKEKDEYFNWPINLDIPENCIKKSPSNFPRLGVKLYYNKLDPNIKLWSKVDPGPEYIISDEYNKLKYLSINPPINKKYYNNGTENILISYNEDIPDGFVRGKIKIVKKRIAPNKDKILINDGTNSIFISATEEIPIGFYLGPAWAPPMQGKTHSEETIAKMSKSAIGKRLGRRAWTEGLTKENSDKMLKISEKISKTLTGKSHDINRHEGRKYYFNSITLEEIYTKDLLDLPWILGRKKHAMVTPFGIFANEKTMKETINVSKYKFKNNHKEFPNEWYYMCP